MNQLKPLRMTDSIATGPVTTTPDQQSNRFPDNLGNLIGILTPDQIRQLAYQTTSQLIAFKRQDFFRGFLEYLEAQGVNISRFFLALSINPVTRAELTPA